MDVRERGAQLAQWGHRETQSRKLQCFIGTIHSFCGRLLRERPFEAGVDPDFTEPDDQQDDRLRRQVWREHVSVLVADNDPILPKLEQLGLRVTTEEVPVRICRCAATVRHSSYRHERSIIERCTGTQAVASGDACAHAA